MSDLENYVDLLARIKQRIQSAQVRAILAVNAELIGLYWEVGALLDARQTEEGWGTAVIPRLARDIEDSFPAVRGFSERNLKRMLAFYRAWPDTPPLDQSVPQAVAQSRKAGADAGEVPQVVALLDGELLAAVPWGHHHVLLDGVKDRQTRRWYLQQARAHGWSRNVLATQLRSQAHLRHGAAVNNFAACLSPPQSDLVQQALKDPYVFDFLTLDETFHERELETGLIRHLEKFLLELGQGFAFVGRQYPLSVGDDDFHIDLLFYHLKLRCFVVIELKRGDFKPEFAGKLNFYCNVVDDRLRHPQDAPTIGLILCQDKNNVLAEYALRGIDKPIGIASYEFTRALPATLQSALPSIESIEAELRALQTPDPEFQP